MPELRVVVAGAGGRMGRALTRAVLGEPKMRLVGALDRPEADVQGKDVGLLAGVEPCGVSVAADPLPAFANTDVLLDFTAPAATLAYAELSAQARIVHVIGTTGIGAEHDERLKAAARHCRIVRSGNMSLGVNLLAALVRRAAATLGPDYDIEIVEMHHRHKVDAPSGTALLLGRAAAEGRGIELAENSVRGRDGHTGARPEGAIGFADAPRRLGRRRPLRDLCRRGRADRAHPSRRKPRQLCPRRHPRRALGLRQEARALRHGRCAWGCTEATKALPSPTPSS